MRVASLGSHRVQERSAAERGASVFSHCASLVRGLFGTEAELAPGLTSRIRQYDVFQQPREWARCRDAGWYHLSRARRAIDREAWDEADQHACKSLYWDDTRAANYLALGESLLRRPDADLDGARAALEAALRLEPANSYIIERLESVYERQGDLTTATAMLRRGLAAGAPAGILEPELDRLSGRQRIPLAS